LSPGGGGPRPRAGSFFRGGELRGLVVFAVVMAVGWPVILSYSRPRADPPPPPVVDPRPIVPDKGVAFDALLDKTPIGFRDNAAYKILLERARATPAAELAAQARRDVFYTQLWERPDLYRGVPLRLEGTLLKTLVHERMNPELAPKGRAVEAWFVTPESRPFPYAVVVEDPPPGLTVGIDQNERIVVDGYFFRLLGYRAGDAPRAAPLLIGRLAWARADPKTGAPAGAGAGGGKSSWSVPVIAIIASVVLYVGVRLAFQVRRVVGPVAAKQGRLLSDHPGDEIAPEALATWLESAGDEANDEAEDDEVPRGGGGRGR